jgi:hypothetical protein
VPREHQHLTARHARTAENLGHLIGQVDEVGGNPGPRNDDLVADPKTTCPGLSGGGRTLSYRQRVVPLDRFNLLIALQRTRPERGGRRLSGG